MIHVKDYYLCNGYTLPKKSIYIHRYGKQDGLICYQMDKWTLSVDKKKRKEVAKANKKNRRGK